jgi:hypothetical protein
MSDKTKKQLHVFENEVPESIIAYDAQDAIKVWEETVGEAYDGGGEFEQVPDDTQYTLYEEVSMDAQPVGVGVSLSEV